MEFDVHVKQHRTLVTRSDRIICVIARLSATNDMSPVYPDFVAGLDVDDLARDGGLEAGLAGNVGIVDTVDWKAMVLVCLGEVLVERLGLLGLLDVATLMPLERPLSCPLTLIIISVAVNSSRRLHAPDALGDGVGQGQGWQSSEDSEELHDGTR
jgi:hypothetical protein